MSRKTATLGAIAALALATTLFPSGRDAAALAEAASPTEAPAPAPEEQVPAAPRFISAPVVQPLPPQDRAAPTLPDAAGEAGSLEQLVAMIDTSAPLDPELRCLAGAVYFEARGEPLTGQLAVAEVILNRAADPRFPATYCGVVRQKGQFSFMRGRHMPPIPTNTPAWKRARAIAEIAHRGLWESRASAAMFFHARHVSPAWRHAKTRLAQIDTHIFYR